MLVVLAVREGGGKRALKGTQKGGQVFVEGMRYTLLLPLLSIYYVATVYGIKESWTR